MMLFVIAMLLGLQTLAILLLCRAIGGLKTTATIENINGQLANARHANNVLARVMEEQGIQFNRDYDGNVVGIVVEIEAPNMTGTGLVRG